MPGKQGAIESLRGALSDVGCKPLPDRWVRRLAIEKTKDEEIVWVARPTDAYGRTEQTAWVSAIAIVLFLLVRVGEALADIDTGNWGKWVIPAAALGTLLLFAAVGWLSPRWDSSKTLYVLTNKRALLMRFGTFLRVRTFPLGDLKKPTRFELDDGCGDLVFERFPLIDEEGNTKTGQNGFYGVADVRQVEKILRELIDQQEKKA